MNVSDPTRKRVLIIEDEPSISNLLTTHLLTLNYTARVEQNGNDGLQAAAEFRPDLIILDLGLPDLDGQAVLLKLREWIKCPIIILTARETDEDKVLALDQGADDYLTKPFSVAELLARVRVAARHFDLAGGATDPRNTYKNGDLECDLLGHTVTVDGQAVRLTATEYDILRVFIKNEGKILTHRALLKEIWGPNAVQHTQYLRVYVSQLRKKLKSRQGLDDLIVTEPGIGYRLTRSIRE